MSVSTQPRYTNGQFGRVSRSESGQLSLDDAELAKTTARLGRVIALRARNESYRDQDDYAQDCALGILVRRAHDPRIMNEKAYLYSIAKSIRSQAISGLARSEDRRAMVELGERLTQWEAEHHRTAPESVRHELAEQIRSEAPPRRRPTRGYHIQHETVSLDAALDAGDTNITAAIIDDLEDRGVEPQMTSQAALKSLDEPIREARAHLWETLRGDSGLPIREASMSRRVVDTTRAAVANAGGPLVIAQRYLDGDATIAERDALFRPFIREEKQEHRSAENDDDVATERARIAGLREKAVKAARIGNASRRDEFLRRARKAEERLESKIDSPARDTGTGVDDEQVRAEIAEIFVRHPQYAEDIWNAVLSRASS